MSKAKQSDSPAAHKSQEWPAPPQPETDFAATHQDEYAGQGGSYEIRDGKRVLVHRTRTTPPRPGGRRSDDPPAGAAE